MSTMRKMIVSAESRMVSAISLGVFCRFAPSTRPIMRSRKVSPGLAVMRILITSESTRVPPVTALRSPPLSRTTGADSPVMADSSTVAAPSMISPSPGMNLAGFHDDDIALAQHAWRRFPPARRRLGGDWPSSRCGPCAGCRPGPCRGLPPSLRRNSRRATVNQSQSAICSRKPNDAPCPPVKSSTVVMTAPTSVTNITGLPTMWRGLSFLNDSPMAGTMIAGSKME